MSATRLVNADEPCAVIVALLHDTLEDTDLTVDDLRREFPGEIVDAVVTLTKLDEESYDEYIERISESDYSLKKV